jgi:hypothetical protein
VPAAVLGDGRQEAGAEVAQLGVANAVDRTQALRRRGPQAGQLAQGGVAEDDVRRDPALDRQFAAQPPQGLEQVAVHPLPRHRLGLRLLGSLSLLAPRQLHQPHRALPAHHLPRGLVEPQLGVVVAHLAQHPLADELVDPVAHVRLAVALEQLVGGQLVVLPLADVVGVLAAQHGDDMVDPEILLHARHARQDLLRRHQGVGHLLGVAQAQVAGVAAGAREVLAEVLHQGLVAADGAAAVAVHVLQVADGAGQERRIDGVLGGGLLEDGAEGDDVGAGVEQDALGLQAVAAGPAGLLLVVLQRLGQGRVQHEAHVGAIDAHPEGHRGHDDVALLARPAFAGRRPGRPRRGGAGSR